MERIGPSGRTGEGGIESLPADKEENLPKGTGLTVPIVKLLLLFGFLVRETLNRGGGLLW